MNLIKIRPNWSSLGDILLAAFSAVRLMLIIFVWNVSSTGLLLFSRTANRLGQMYKIDPITMHQCTLATTDNLMAICRTMGSQSELRNWLLARVRYLVQKGW